MKLLLLGILFHSVEISNTQVAATQQRLEVRELKDPRFYRAPGLIEFLRLKINGKKNFLQDVFRLRPVAENSVCDRDYPPAIAIEQESETLRAALANVVKQDFVSHRP